MNVNELAEALARTEGGSAVLALHPEAPMIDVLRAEREDLLTGARLGLVDEDGESPPSAS